MNARFRAVLSVTFIPNSWLHRNPKDRYLGPIPCPVVDRAAQNFNQSVDGPR